MSGSKEPALSCFGIIIVSFPNRSSLKIATCVLGNFGSCKLYIYRGIHNRLEYWGGGGGGAIAFILFRETGSLLALDSAENNSAWSFQTLTSRHRT